MHVATSFYSDQAAVHDSITQHPGSFERTVTGIKRFVAAGLSVRVGVIETEANAGHADRAIRFLEAIGVSEIRVDSKRGIGRGAESLYALDPMSELCGECWKGKLCITASGSAYPCVFSRFADVGTAFNGVDKVLRGDALSGFRDTLKKYRLKKKPEGDGSTNEHRRPDAASSAYAMGTCGPHVICNPDLECSPNCLPGSSKCMPFVFCAPDSSCSPDRSCNPTTVPRDPYPKCNPQF